MNEQQATRTLSVNVGNNIRRWRHQHSMTQIELSKRIGLSQSYFSKIELGQKNPNLNTLSKLSKATGITIGELLNEPSE